MRHSCLVFLLFAACRSASPREDIQVVLPMDGHYGSSSRFLFTLSVFAFEEPAGKALGKVYDDSGRAAFGITSNIAASEWVTEHLIRALRADVVNAHRVAVFPSQGLVLSGKIIDCSMEGPPDRVTCRLWVRFILYKDGKFCRKVEYSESQTFMYLAEPSEHVLTKLLRAILQQASPAIVRLLMEN